MPSAATNSATLVAAGFHALSDPTRIEVVELLRSGERCVCELMEALDAAQSRLSFHLKVLREAGLVTDRRDGRWVYYTLNDDALSEIEDCVAYLRPNSVVSSARKAARTPCCA